MLAQHLLPLFVEPPRSDASPNRTPGGLRRRLTAWSRWWSTSEAAVAARLGYNPGMTVTNAVTPDRTADPTDPSLVPPVDAVDPGRDIGLEIGLPAGLTEVDLDRIAAAATASRAATTRTVYASQWRLWERWCTDRGVDPLGGDPVLVCAYLTERAAAGLSVAGLDVACSGIRDAYLAAGLVTPTDHPMARRVRAGLRRTYGAAPRRQARALTVDELGQILARIDRTSPAGARDAAILLVGYAGALRRSDLAGLELADLEPRSAGLLVTIRRSKTDQERRGDVIGIAHGRRRLTDPIAALNTWLDHRGSGHGSLFTRIYHGRVHATGLSPHTVGVIIRERGRASGIDSNRITSHSLRAGHVTSAATAGVPLERIAAQTRHRDFNVLRERYIRPLEALATTSSSDLGL